MPARSRGRSGRRFRCSSILRGCTVIGGVPWRPTRWRAAEPGCRRWPRAPTSEPGPRRGRLRSTTRRPGPRWPPTPPPPPRDPTGLQGIRSPGAGQGLPGPAEPPGPAGPARPAGSARTIPASRATRASRLPQPAGLRGGSAELSGPAGQSGLHRLPGISGFAGLPGAAAIPRAAGLSNRSGRPGGMGWPAAGRPARAGNARRARGVVLAGRPGAPPRKRPKWLIPVGAAAAVVVVVVALVLTLGGGSSRQNNAGSTRAPVRLRRSRTAPPPARPRPWATCSSPSSRPATA